MFEVNKQVFKNGNSFPGILELILIIDITSFLFIFVQTI